MFPHIAAAIGDAHARTGDWASRDEIVSTMLSDSRARPLIEAAAKKQTRSASLAEIAGNIVDWWSAQWTVKKNPYQPNFERHPTERPYWYRPAHAASTGGKSSGQISDDRVRATGGQGIGLSSSEKKAVETRAMEEAYAWLATRFPRGSIVDTSANKPYDYRVDDQDGTAFFVEVKGTTGSDCTVVVTEGEIQHAKANGGRCLLLVLTGIRLTRVPTPRADGGSLTVFEPWDPTNGSLVPRSYTHVPRHVI